MLVRNVSAPESRFSIRRLQIVNDDASIVQPDNYHVRVVGMNVCGHSARFSHADVFRERWVLQGEQADGSFFDGFRKIHLKEN